MTENELLQAVERSAPVVRAHADEAERDRRLPRPVLDAMGEAGLQRMMLPRALGGLEVDPVTYTRVTEALSAVDSVAGWTLQASSPSARR